MGVTMFCSVFSIIFFIIPTQSSLIENCGLRQDFSTEIIPVNAEFWRPGVERSKDMLDNILNKITNFERSLKCQELFLNSAGLGKLNQNKKVIVHKSAKDAILSFTSEICNGLPIGTKRKKKHQKLNEVDLTCVESEQLFGMEYQKLFEKYYCRDEPLFEKIEVAWDVCLEHHYPWIESSSFNICEVKSSFGKFVACYCSKDEVLGSQEDNNSTNISRSFCISKPECYLANSGIHHFEESAEDVISTNCTLHLSYVLDGGYNSHSWYIIAQAKDRLRPRAPYSEHSPCRGKNFTSPFDVGQLILDDLNNEIIIWKPEGYQSYKNFTIYEEEEEYLEESLKNTLKEELEMIDKILGSDDFFDDSSEQKLQQCINQLKDGPQKQIQIFRTIYTKVLKEKLIINMSVSLVLGLILGYILTLSSRTTIKESFWLSSILHLCRTCIVYLEIYEMGRYLVFWTYISFFSFLTSWKFVLAFFACHIYLSRIKCDECKDNFVLHFWKISLANLFLDLPALTLIQTLSGVTAVTAVRIIHIFSTFCVASYTFMSTSSPKLLCDEHHKLELEDKKTKPEKRNSHSHNNNDSKQIENRKQIKNRGYKKLCEDKLIKKEASRHKSSTKTVFLSPNSCDLSNFNSTDKGDIKRSNVGPKTKKTPKTTNKAKPKCDIKLKENKKLGNSNSTTNTTTALDSINLKSFCDMDIKSLMLNDNTIFKVPQLLPANANLNSQKQPALSSVETIRFTQGFGSKPQSSTFFDLIRKTPPPPINHIKQPSPRTSNQAKPLSIKTTNLIKGKSLAPPGFEDVTPNNLNHWINSYNPIGTPSNSKSKFLPFITRSQGEGDGCDHQSSSGGHSPVSSKCDEDEIDFKLEENESEMFCLEDDIKEDDHSSEISSYQGSCSPVQGCSFSPTSCSPSSSTSSASHNKKQQQISRNLQLAMILSREIPQYDVESIAMALDNILQAKSTTSLTLNQFRDLVIEELSREDCGQQNQEDIFISDSEDEEVIVEEECPICTEVMLEQTISLEMCNHKFHSECIKPWLLKQNSCPTCRRSVNKEE